MNKQSVQGIIFYHLLNILMGIYMKCYLHRNALGLYICSAAFPYLAMLIKSQIPQRYHIVEINHFYVLCSWTSFVLYHYPPSYQFKWFLALFQKGLYYSLEAFFIIKIKVKINYMILEIFDFDAKSKDKLYDPWNL